MQAIRSGGERDALGRVTESKHYDATNFRTRIVQVYDGLGRETKHCVSKVPDGPCTTSTASTAASTMEYDSLGRRTLWTDGNGGTWRATYDSAGNLLGQDDPVAGQHRVFCYDPLNRVVRTLTIDDDTLEDPIAHATRCGEANPAATAVADYSYDERAERGCSYYARGRLCAIDERQGTDVTLATVFTYDARRRVVSEGVTRRLVVGGRTLTPAATVVYAYDAADRQKGVVVPTSSSAQSQTVTTRYDDLGRIRLVSAAGQTFARDLRYDRFGRLTAWTDGGGVTERATYDQSGAGRFRLSALSVSGPGTQAPVLQALGFSMYDAAGNLTALGDTTPESTYASDSPLRNAWSYAYDGLGRLVLASKNSEPVTLYAYDGLGNRTRAGALVSFYDNAPAPQRVQTVTPGGAVSHDPSGSVTGLPALGAAAARTLNYDAEGRLAMVTGGGAAVRFVHDARGQRVARIVNEGAAGEQVTVYYGRWFEVTGGTLTRHIYLGERRIGHSPVAAPSGLTLARGYDGERAVVLARAMEAAVRRDGWARPRVAVEAAAAAAALAGIAAAGLILVVVSRRRGDHGTGSPDRGCQVRLGMVGRLARGPVALVVVVLVSALLP